MIFKQTNLSKVFLNILEIIHRNLCIHLYIFVQFFNALFLIMVFYERCVLNVQYILYTSESLNCPRPPYYTFNS